MKAHNITSTIVKNWWLLIATTLIACGIGLYLSHLQDPLFQAQSTYIVDPTVGEEQQNISRINTLNRDTKVVTTFCGILEGTETLNQALAKVDVPLDAGVPYQTSCIVQPNSNVLEITVTGPSPVLAAHLANALGEVSRVGPNTVQQEFLLNSSTIATVDNRAISPDHLVNTVMGGLIGLFAGLTLALLGGLFTRRERPIEQPIMTTAQPMPAVATNRSNQKSIYPISR